jgi:hypothetical protein
MALGLYGGDPFVPGNAIGQNDYYIGDGTTKTYLLGNKFAVELGNMIQAGNTFFRRSNGGVIIPDSTHFTLHLRQLRRQP